MSLPDDTNDTLGHFATEINNDPGIKIPGALPGAASFVDTIYAPETFTPAVPERHVPFHDVFRWF
jgi:hypothetical protein